MNKQTCCSIVIFLFDFIYYIFSERLVTFTSLKIGVSAVPWYCLNCTTYGYSWDKVETKNKLFLWANCGKYKLLM